MKNIFEILTENGIEIPEEKKDTIKRSVFENYKTVKEFETQKNKLDTATETINGLQTEIETLKTSGADVEELQKRLTEYENAETERRNREAEEAKTAALKSRFSPLKGEKIFLNEGTENWIFSEFVKALDEEKYKGKGDTEIYEEITKDKNIYTNPNSSFKTPPVGSCSQDSGDESYLQSYYKGNPFFK